MILIKDVIIENHPYDHVIVPKDDAYKIPDVSCSNTPMNSFFEVEHVYGTTFINRWGEKVDIGATKKVQDTIGLCFEAYDNMRREIDRWYSNSCMHEYEAKKNKELLLEYTQMTFWQRLKFLFKGANYAHRSS